MKLTYYKAKDSSESLPQIGIGAARFICPQCGEMEIIRTLRARKTATRYTCPKCQFTGPN